MPRTRLMDTDEDYARLGVSRNAIEPWEDGRRNDSSPGAFEWWYIDALLDDGSTLVFTYADKTQYKFAESKPWPYVKVVMTRPGAEDVTCRLEYTAEESSFGKDVCDVSIGPHSFSGDLKEYTLHFENVEGVGADLKLVNHGTPWRPGTGYIGFGDNDEQYFTWFCVVPAGEITGTITVDGETKEVHGSCYHDHQWGTIHMLNAWNHWIWARQKVGKYNILVSDLTANPTYGQHRYHLAFIQDENGKTVFENFENAKFAVLEKYFDEKLEKTCPSKFSLSYDNGGMQVDYTVSQKEKLESRNEYKDADPMIQAAFDAMGLYPGYLRLAGEGELVMRDDGKTILETGKLLYELAYLSKEFAES